MAMAEERETFSRDWFAVQAPFEGSESDRRAAAAAVHEFRTLAAHWYGSGGDRRFAERLPASAALVDELRADASYVRRNGRLETPRLMRLEVLSSALTTATSAEVRTREFWVTEFHWTNGGMSDEPRSDLVYASYRLTKDGARWIVAAWDPVEPPREEPSR